MGNLVGNISRKAVKPFKNYNVESRAHKLITKDKPTPAPHHRHTELVHKVMTVEQKDSMEKDLLRTDEKLLERLQQVYVTSLDPIKEEDSQFSKRSLPLNREYIAPPLYGYHEPKRVPYGKITLKSALDLISKHQQDNEKWTIPILAEEYNLDEANTNQLLTYFKTFTLVIPTPAGETNKPIFKAPPMLMGAHNVIHFPKENKYLENSAAPGT